MSGEQKRSATDAVTASSKPRPQRNAKGQKGRNAPFSKGGGGKPGPQIPHYLKLSPFYLEWKAGAKALAERLSSFDMSVSELGKAIAEYSAKGCVFEIDRSLVQAYAKYEAARTGWEKFRDSFRAEMDASSVPVGVAAKLLAPANRDSNPDE